MRFSISQGDKPAPKQKRKILPANEVVDLMISRRKETNPDEHWSRDIPLKVQEDIFPLCPGRARESEAGRGAIVFDLIGDVPILNGALRDRVLLSIKSTRGKKRKFGRTCIFTTGTRTHIDGVISALKNPMHVFSVIHVHQDTDNGRWAQISFDMGSLYRRLAAKYTDTDTGIPGVAWATTERGVPMVLRETPRAGTENVYYQLNINYAALCVEKGGPVPWAPGVVGLGMLNPWRFVDGPQIEYSIEDDD